jgi:hypothetical protein
MKWDDVADFVQEHSESDVLCADKFIVTYKAWREEKSRQRRKYKKPAQAQPSYKSDESSSLPTPSVLSSDCPSDSSSTQEAAQPGLPIFHFSEMKRLPKRRRRRRSRNRPATLDQPEPLEPASILDQPSPALLCSISPVSKPPPAPDFGSPESSILPSSTILHPPFDQLDLPEQHFVAEDLQGEKPSEELDDFSKTDSAVDGPSANPDRWLTMDLDTFMKELDSF